MATYVGNGDGNVYSGTDFADDIDGKGGDDTLSGLAGNDSIVGGHGADRIRGDAGKDSLLGGGGDDIIDDVSDDDRDYADGGAGDDFISGAAKDRLHGGDGTDRLLLSLYQLSDLDLDLSGYTPGGSVTFGATTFSGFETGAIYFTNGHDRIVAPSAPFDLYGLLGNDTLIGGEAGDLLSGGQGHADDADVLKGGGGDDVLDGGLGDRFAGGDGEDRFLFIVEALRAPPFFGAFDVDFSAMAAGEKVSLGYGASVINVEQGVAYFASGDDKIRTGEALVTVWGRAGNDTLIGGDRDDVLKGGTGNDVIRGGAGFDEAGYNSAQSAVTVDLSLTGWQQTGGEDADLLSVIEALNGSGYDDRLTGDGADNRLIGAGGNDTLTGGQGDDILVGGLLGDISGQGVDRLSGGAGQDTLSSGDGEDVLVWSSISHTTTAAPDLITDLAAGDVIHLQDIDADTTTAGDQAFTLVASLTGAAGQLALDFDGSRTRFLMDTNGDGAADGVIEADGDHTGHTDFVL